jgi:hypothetical protein
MADESFILVHIVVAEDLAGNRTELGKFFDADSAERHRENIARSRTSNWRNHAVESRHERAADQHPAHAEHVAGMERVTVKQLREAEQTAADDGANFDVILAGMHKDVATR